MPPALPRPRPDVERVDFLAPVRAFVERAGFAGAVPPVEEVLAPADALLARPRVPVDLAAVDLARPLPALDVLARPRPLLDEEVLSLLEPESSSLVQRPESTRCAASATASAMIEPSRVALDTAAVAALLALSAASRPASRILRRAAGLALIAAAAAARPAASISRLIAAFASLSTVLSFEDLFLFPCFAILHLPLSRQRHFKDVTVPYRRRKPAPQSAAGEFIRCSRLCCKAAKLDGIPPMTLSGMLASFLALLGLGGTEADVQQRSVSRVVMQEEIIVRVPVQPRAQAFEWEEHKGPKCIAANDIRGAKLSGPRQVDFMLKNRTRVRAKFDDDCHALDYYGGLYLDRPDERLCAKRDSVRSRVGGSCRIEKFRTLTPKVKR